MNYYFIMPPKPFNQYLRLPKKHSRMTHATTVLTQITQTYTSVSVDTIISSTVSFECAFLWLQHCDWSIMSC